MRVLGVDACRGGWIGIALSDGAFEAAFFGATIDALILKAAGEPDLAVVAIDIPIDPPETGERPVDAEVRSAVGRRSSSVFTTPTRAALALASAPAEASERNRERGGKGVTRQALALAPKILEVDAWLKTTAISVIEVHPELSFTCLARGHLASKRTWAGTTLRRHHLQAAGIVIPDDLGDVGTRAGADDVLDAAAAAWTANRHASGDLTRFPRAHDQDGPLIWA